FDIEIVSHIGNELRRMETRYAVENTMSRQNNETRIVHACEEHRDEIIGFFAGMIWILEPARVAILKRRLVPVVSVGYEYPLIPDHFGYRQNRLLVFQAPQSVPDILKRYIDKRRPFAR